MKLRSSRQLKKRYIAALRWVAQFMRKQQQLLCSFIFPIGVHLLFQFEIHSFPQKGDKEGAEKSDSNRHGLLEMG